MQFVLFLFLRFCSSICFTLWSTLCERTSVMEFTLEKLKTCIVKSAILLFTDFTTENISSRFQQFAVLKRISSQKPMVFQSFNNNVAILLKRELTLDLAEKPLWWKLLFSKSKVYPSNFIKNELQLRGLYTRVIYP